MNAIIHYPLRLAALESVRYDALQAYRTNPGVLTRKELFSAVQAVENERKKLQTQNATVKVR